MHLPVPNVLNLAASWYVALTSGELSRKPRALRLFGEDLVAWRDGEGRAVIMQGACPHMGASLAAGKVVDGCLRCPFHHWRFSGSGQCVEAPGVERLPATARQQVYPTVERYGYVWAWYGGPEPLFPLPDFPPLEEEKAGYLAFRFADHTKGTVRRILENGYDYQHFLALHGAAVSAPLKLKMLSHPSESRANGPPIAPEAWLGAVVEGPVFSLSLFNNPLESMRSVAIPFVRGEKFTLLIDGWPGGQRFTAYLDGEELYKVLLGMTPVGERVSVQHQWVTVKRTGKRWKDLLYSLLFYVQNRAATLQDVPIYNTTRSDGADLYLGHDHGVFKFRDYYQKWVGRAAEAP